MATLLFDDRNIDGPVYEIPGERRAGVATFGIPEFKALLKKRSVAA